MAIYRDRFGSADGLTFIITGDFNIDSIAPLVTSYLGALPTTKVNQHYRDLGLRIASGKIELNLKAGTDDKSQAMMLFNGPANYSLKEINEFYAAVEIIKQRITHVLREQLSLTYNGTISGNMERAPYENYSISAAFPCAPENALQVIAALTKEIENLKRDGPRQDELDTVKQIWIKNREVEKQSNQFWSGGLQSAVLYDTDPASMLTYERRISTITVDQVRQAAVRYFDFNNVMQAILYPAESKTASAPTSALTH
jgi:zinc protease